MKNQKGFTLIELLAVIIIATTVLVPMLSGLIGNYEVNQRMHARKAASSISLTTVAAFDKIYIEDLKAQLGTEQIITEVTSESCPDFEGRGDEPNLDSDEICAMIFDQEWNSIQFTDPDAFKVYIYPYYMTQTDIDDIQAMEDLPESVRTEVAELDPTDPEEVPERDAVDILRMSVRIVYDEETGQQITSSGVVSGG